MKELHENALRVDGLCHGRVRVIHTRIVLVGQEAEADLSRRVVRQRLPDRNEVFQTFRHFRALDVQMANMQPVINPLVGVVVGLGLSELVLVVGELQVYTT